MSNNLINVNLLWILLLFTGISCSKKKDEEIILNLIKKGVELAEEHNADDLLDLVTEDFEASPENLDAGDVKRVLFLAFKHYGEFTIHYPSPSIDLAEDALSAKAEIHFIIINKDKTIPGLKELYDDPLQWLEKAGEKADLYQLNLDLDKIKGDWLVKKAQVKGFEGLGF